MKINKKDEDVVKRDLLEETRHFDICDMNELLLKIKENTRDSNIKVDEMEPLEEDEYVTTLSSACCDVDDIQNIIFGPTTSRFWIFRKHMNTYSPEKFQDEKNIPFLSW